VRANLTVLHQHVFLGLILGGCVPKDAPPVDDSGTDDSGSDDTGTIERSCDEHPELSVDEGLDAEDQTRMVCMEKTDECPEAADVNGWDLVQGVMGSDPVDGGCSTWNGTVQCGPEALEVDRCCYIVDVTVDWCDIGRPFSVKGEARRSAVHETGNWTESVHIKLSLSPELRGRLADYWTRMALAEHASIAAFARFQLQLLELAAPPELCAAATRAMGDEIRHARDSFAVASVFHGRQVGPGPLNTQGALSGNDPLLDAFLEGCLGETIAAAQAAAAAQACTEPAIRVLLEGIAEDEARHAALAWRFARWMLVEHPEAKARLRAALDAYQLGPPPAADPDADTLRSYGRLPDREMHQVATQALAEVIRPAAAQLLGLAPRKASPRASVAS